MNLPPFPVDDQTLDLLDAALTGTPDGRSSVGDLCDLLSEMAGSDLTAVAERTDDGIAVMRDPCYHHNDVIAALIAEVRRLRGRVGAPWDWKTARAAGVPLGHSIVSHQHLGWGYCCRYVDPTAECMGWRLLALGEPRPDIERARLWSEP